MSILNKNIGIGITMSKHLPNVYNITVIDHISQRKSELTLDDAIHKFNCDLSKFDCVMLSLATHDTLTSYRQYKPAKSMLVITNNNASSAKPINYLDFSTVNCKFATPELSTDLFLDNLELTIDLTKNEAKVLKRKLIKADKKHNRITFSERKDNSAKFKSIVNVNSGTESTLSILLDPAFKGINRLKVSYNPNKVSPKDLHTFFTILKSIIGNEYRHRILNANITRFDVTFDGDGYYVEDLLFSLAKGTYFKQFINQCNDVESTIIGANKSLRIIAYNKTLEAKLNNDIYIKTRFELTIRPYNIKNLAGLKLKHIIELDSVLSGLKVFNKHKVMEELGMNSIDFNIIKNHGISALRRTKNNTDRVKLTHTLKECLLEVDALGFNSMIIELLIEQRKKLLYCK